MGKDGRLTKEELLNRYPPPSEMLDKLFTGLIGALANPAYKYTTGDTPDYRDVLSALTGSEKRDWGDVIKEVFPKIQKKLPENVHLNPRMAGTWGGVLNMLLDPTNLVPGAAMAGEIKNVRHVSPYTFDKFDLTRIGTGEGHQTFGHGAYFTESDDVVENYVDAFSKSVSPSIDDLEKYFKPGRIVNSYGGRDKVLGFKRFKDKSGYEDWYVTVQKVDKNGNLIDYERPRTHHTQPNNTELKQVLGDEYKPVNVYEATLFKGRPHTMLQWDKPLSEQPQQVIDVLNALDFHPSDAHRGSDLYQYIARLRGEQLYRESHGAIRNEPDYEWASQYLKSLGIDGIEFPSGTLSGIKDSPHKNYVVFDDADITIEKRTPR